MIYSRELGLSVIGEAAAQHPSNPTFDEVLKLYHRLKGVGKTKLFLRDLSEALGISKTASVIIESIVWRLGVADNFAIKF